MIANRKEWLATRGAPWYRLDIHVQRWLFDRRMQDIYDNPRSRAELLMIADDLETLADALEESL